MNDGRFEVISAIYAGIESAMRRNRFEERADALIDIYASASRELKLVVVSVLIQHIAESRPEIIETPTVPSSDESKSQKEPSSQPSQTSQEPSGKETT